MAVGFWKDPADQQYKPLPAGLHTHDDRYVQETGDTMSGPLVAPEITTDRLILPSGEAEAGRVWTGIDDQGHGDWAETSALIVADTSDPVLISWFDQHLEGWVLWSGSGSLVYEEVVASPDIPGCAKTVGTAWVEWQRGGTRPMVFEPEAVYRITVKVRLTQGTKFSFGWQCYSEGDGVELDPPTVDTGGGISLYAPHWVGHQLQADEGAWYVDDANPGAWHQWTGYVYGRGETVAEGVPGFGELAENINQPVKVSVGTTRWRPLFTADVGTVWVDSFQVFRLEPSLELPGGIVTEGTVTADRVVTDELVIPPSTPGWLLTAIDEAGQSEWQPMPVTVSIGPPVGVPGNPATINLGTLAQRHADSVYVLTGAVTITATASARIPSAEAIQWTQEVPAMVSIRLLCYGNQSAGSSADLHVNIGVEDDTATLLYTEDYGGQNTSTIAGGCRMRLLTSGGNVPMAAHYRRYLQPGTYLAYPRAYVSAVDASVAKLINTLTMHFEIDPGLSYLPGHAGT